LFVLAQHIPAQMNPFEAICEATGIGKTPAALLAHLDRLGSVSAGRALLVVDGINEGDRRRW